MSTPITLSRILHAGYLLEVEDTAIAFDPIFENPFSTNCHAFPDLRFDAAQIRSLELDAVFISHHHDDHCSLVSLDHLRRDTPIYLYCQEPALFELIEALGFTVQRLVLDLPVKVGPIRVTPRRALDEDVDSMFEIEAEGHRILNVVDSWIAPSTLDRLRARGPWDLVLWPFQTMRELEVLIPSRPPEPPTIPPEWIEQLQLLRPLHLVPSSCQFQMEPWSWYNRAFFPISYRHFAAELASALPNTRLVRLDPGASVRLSDHRVLPGPELPWIERTTEEEVDYHYDPSLPPQPTAEIAQRFGPLSVALTERVLDYCARQLPERYLQLESGSDTYPEKAIRWRLSVFDHRGAVTHFDYRREGPALTPIQGAGGFDWITEVPLRKLYAALEEGESLTSMYLRVAQAPADADVLEDPLIRCLFSGDLAAFQRAQLRRLATGAALSRP